jgi:hypothetical protein
LNIAEAADWNSDTDYFGFAAMNRYLSDCSGFVAKNLYLSDTDYSGFAAMNLCSKVPYSEFRNFYKILLSVYFVFRNCYKYS